MKKHYRDVGVFSTEKLTTEQEVVLRFWADEQELFLHMDRWNASFLAKQIRDILDADLKRAQERRDIFK